MNPPPVLDDVAAAQPNPRPHQPETSPFPRLAASRLPPKDPPSSRIASGLFDDRDRPEAVEILLRTRPTRRKVDWAAGYASRRAERHGPTALITMEPGALRIQLHGAGETIPTLPESIEGRVDWAISWVSWFARSTVVVPVEQDRLGAYLDWDVPIHLLTEAINTSITDTYLWVKRIHVTCREYKVRTPRLDLVLIDAPDQLARLCANTLEKTTRRFLDRTLRTDCIIDRMPKATPVLELNYDLEPGYGCDQVLEILDCRQRNRRQGRLGSPFS